jgi:hypothetical protein
MTALKVKNYWLEGSVTSQGCAAARTLELRPMSFYRMALCPRK